eukprot:TRINITY_DN14058_c0_g1_i1.p1 TRINITY_DN14058_c0_g1~~TRINITY_DN14058_c0_g1_i1.p1  ORF type:complete len:465 (+),score=133.55 TRINITY_DN14058_c0_g1_i1:62-1396(+)
MSSNLAPVNYKSVLLCARPSEKSSAPKGGGGGGSKSSGSSKSSSGGGASSNSRGGAFKPAVAKSEALYVPPKNANQEAKEQVRKERAAAKKDDFNQRYKRQLKEYSAMVTKQRKEDENGKDGFLAKKVSLVAQLDFTRLYRPRNQHAGSSTNNLPSTHSSSPFPPSLCPLSPSLSIRFPISFLFFSDRYSLFFFQPPKVSSKITEALKQTAPDHPTLKKDEGKDKGGNGSRRGSEANKSKGGKKKKKPQSKPAWAMTEDQIEEKEEEEIEELLDFCESLDYEKYVNDLEIQMMMDAIQSKVLELELQNLMEEENLVDENGDLLDAETLEQKMELDEADIEEAEEEKPELSHKQIEERARKRKLMKLLIERSRKAKNPSDGSDGGQEGQDGTNGDVSAFSKRQQAQRVLHSSHSLRGVHSSASVQAILDKANANNKEEDMQVMEL